MIEHRKEPPSLDDYRRLYATTGWDRQRPVAREELEAALENSWRWVTAHEAGETVGCGRVVSEGSMYGFICDLIVAPAHRGKGIGRAMLAHLSDACQQARLRRVWLFAASGNAPFYEKCGFERRPPDAPGMQLRE